MLLLCTALIWRRTTSLRVLLNEHTEQENGLSPVCVRTCRVKSRPVLKVARWQKGQISNRDLACGPKRNAPASTSIS